MFGGKATLSANANYTKNQVTRAGPLIAGDRERLLELEDFVPDWKGGVNFNYQGDRIGFTTTASYYGKWTDFRSEEHTSELQSLMRISYAVFCLKTKKTQKKSTVIISKILAI